MLQNKLLLTQTDPYDAIAGFFSYIGLASARQYITGMLQYACSNGYWKRRSPGSLLFFYQNLVSLVEAAHNLVANPALRREDEVSHPLFGNMAKRNEISPELYVGWQSGATPWNCFPRFITKNEFVRPHTVFFKFFRFYSLQEWRNELEEILFHALSKGSVFDAGISIDLLSLHTQLQKLLEAAHLVEVRMTNKKG